MTQVPISKLNAVLYLDTDIRFLPLWLDYHKSIFDSLTIILKDLPERNIFHIVSRFFKDVNYTIYPVSISRLHKNKLNISLTTAEFLLESDKETIFEYRLGNNEFQKTPAKIKTDPFPNNIPDFLQNIQTADDFYNIQILSYKNQFVIERMKLLPPLKPEDRIYYLDAYSYSNVDWGEDKIILQEDVNLLDCTDFNEVGHKIF